ncbi:hypothetical protein CFP65_0645 [Kitasatospora sp. MMS16-BH015]|uniref:hypothetical protein n=1 Tax=Kitasatospora sp. MMS16-BH015 TaxID=2018025 RepID=UPI000CA1EBC2|nr:hypothetical protein [Kitasatospora sp. MMS16-BH015]AUG75600.1 hypothetical protein CFP65_0645 [Kitasatospora sp. MMS16-BH015]
MLLLGLILLGAAGAFTGLAIADNLGGGPDYTVTVLGNDIATMNSLAVFLAGLALVFAFGCLLAFTGGARARRRNVELQAARLAARNGAPEQTGAGSAAVPTGRPAAPPVDDLPRHKRPSWRHRFTH